MSSRDVAHQKAERSAAVSRGGKRTGLVPLKASQVAAAKRVDSLLERILGDAGASAVRRGEQPSGRDDRAVEPAGE